jgi:hypothetical protein
MTTVTITTESFDEMYERFVKTNPPEGAVFTVYALPNGQHVWCSDGPMPQEHIDSIPLTVVNSRTYSSH